MVEMLLMNMIKDIFQHFAVNYFVKKQQLKTMN